MHHVRVGIRMMLICPAEQLFEVTTRVCGLYSLNTDFGKELKSRDCLADVMEAMITIKQPQEVEVVQPVCGSTFRFVLGMHRPVA